MKISTKGRYALRVMIDLAEHNDASYITLKEVSKRQEISEKYLESIISVLSKAGFVSGLRGKGGGYKLSRSPETYTVGSILKLTEGSLAPVACLGSKTIKCERASDCKTLPMWEKLDKLIDDFFEGITLADFIKPENGTGDYII
ncbi:MAG: RrF2 family transcriptional regulator [Candidatus Metalachnospira sp.]|nr:RrF2 family transcriptional regulator [Candidatus Metalachnospira sp.]